MLCHVTVSRNISIWYRDTSYDMRSRDIRLLDLRVSHQRVTSHSEVALHDQVA